MRRAASLKSTLSSRLTSSMPSPAPHREQIQVPRPSLSSKRNRSLPPHIGQGPCLLLSVFAVTPRAESIPRHLPRTRSRRGSCSIASPLLPAPVEGDLLRLQPVQEDAIRSGGNVDKPARPGAEASLVLRCGIGELVPALALNPQQHRVHLLPRMGLGLCSSASQLD